MCPQCHLAIRLDGSDLKAVTTGIIVCPRCDRSKRIEIEIVKRESTVRRWLGFEPQMS